MLLDLVVDDTVNVEVEENRSFSAIYEIARADLAAVEYAEVDEVVAYVCGKDPANYGTSTRSLEAQRVVYLIEKYVAPRLEQVVRPVLLTPEEYSVVVRLPAPR